jgi:hypothetical protein
MLMIIIIVCMMREKKVEFYLDCFQWIDQRCMFHMKWWMTLGCFRWIGQGYESRS